MRRTGERGHRRGDGGMEVRLGAYHHPRREGGRVRAVLGMQHHVGVHKRAGVLARGLPLEHVKEIRGVAEPRARRYRVPAVAHVVMRAHDHRHLRRQPDALAAGRIERVVAGLRVVRGKRGDRGPQHVHGMRVLHRADDVVDRPRQGARFLQRGIEGLELGPAGQLAVEQEVGGLLEGRMQGEIVDRVPAIAQLAGPAVDERGRRSLEAQILQAAMHLGLAGLGHGPLLRFRIQARTLARAAGHAIASVVGRYA